jgi:hypothetical protein
MKMLYLSANKKLGLPQLLAGAGAGAAYSFVTHSLHICIYNFKRASRATYILGLHM